MENSIEIVKTGEEILCYIIRRSLTPEKTMFVTPSDAKQQVGFIVYPAGTSIKRHIHRPLERHLIGMSEVLVVRSGRCEIELYDRDKKPVTSRGLNSGDVVILISGGHGFKILEDTVFLEIKQGPYLGAEDKELF
jgi:hypothetical protein